MLRRLSALGFFIGFLVIVLGTAAAPAAADVCRHRCPTPTPIPITPTPAPVTSTPVPLSPPSSVPGQALAPTAPPGPPTPAGGTPAPTTPPTPYTDLIVVQPAAQPADQPLSSAVAASYAPQPLGSGTALAGFTIVAMVGLLLVALGSFVLFLRLR